MKPLFVHEAIRFASDPATRSEFKDTSHDQTFLDDDSDSFPIRPCGSSRG